MLIAFHNGLGDVEIAVHQSLHEIIGSEGGSGGCQRQGQFRVVDMPLKYRQGLFGFLACVFEQLEAHMKILLLDDGRNYL